MNRPWRIILAIAVTLLAGVATQAALAGSGALRSSPDANWGEAEAAHLLRRAGFGGTPAQIDYLATLGRDAAVDYLVDYETVPRGDTPYPHRDDDTRPLERRLTADLGEEERREITNMVRRLNERHMQAVREWWIRRMVVSPRPLEEKMTLFWHGHLTSGYREVRSWHLMYEQNDFLRENALGDFEDILLGISQDGAMLRYLDNARNVKTHPNENYARELMELFSLGEGNYSEKDIREVARAFTGWGLDLNEYQFYPNRHDFGRKSVFGKRGQLDGDDVVRLIVKHPKSSRYMAQEIWEYFAYPDPEKEIVEGLARVLRDHGFQFKEALRVLFKSDAFYSDRALYTRIKSPVELVVGSVRLLEVAEVNPSGLYHACRQMGQNLFQPPNVKGWDGGERWITTNTLFARYNFAADLLGMTGRLGRQAKNMARERAKGAAMMEGQVMRPTLGEISERSIAVAPYDPLPMLRRYGLDTPGKIVRHYLERLLQREVSEERFQIVLQAFSPDDRPFRRNAPDAAIRIREMIRLIMSMPEYQLG